MKISKKGRLALQAASTAPQDGAAGLDPAEENQLVPVFRSGQMLKKWDFGELIEQRARLPGLLLDYIEPMRKAAVGAPASWRLARTPPRRVSGRSEPSSP
ncbi:MAG: hypothetical protein U0R26_08390 [Solirubrobacterales bacterium]